MRRNAKRLPDWWGIQSTADFTGERAADRDPSTPHLLSLRDADAPLRMTTLLAFDYGFLVHRPHIIRQYQDERAVSRGRASEDSATEDFYRGVVGEG
jgi:hypothetical protein